MTNAPIILAIVCCRGGSKGLPGKNIRPLHGKPLLAWTLEQAQACGICTDIAVSSDSDEILDVARRFGANILISRPNELATDTVGTLPALTHGVRAAMAQSGRHYDYIVLLQATSPLRLASDIQDAVRLAVDSKAPSVVSATPSKNSPYFTIYEHDAAGRLHISKSNGKSDIPRRQDTPSTFDLNGSIYVWDADRYLSEERTVFPDSKLYVMPEERSLDIDTLRDFVIAETMMEKGLWLPQAAV